MKLAVLAIVPLLVLASVPPQAQAVRVAPQREQIAPMLLDPLWFIRDGKGLPDGFPDHRGRCRG